MAEYTVTDFSAGELAPRFWGRFDLSQYQKAAKLIRNIIVTPEGAAMRRQGTKYITNAHDSSSQVAIIRMQHSSSDATLIEMGDGYMRFFKNGEVVLDDDTFNPDGSRNPGSGSELIVSTPYTGEQVREVQYAHFGGFKLYITHTEHAPRLLRLLNDSSSSPAFVLDTPSYEIFNWDSSNADEWSSEVTYSRSDFVIYRSDVDDDGNDEQRIFKSIQNDNKGNDPETTDAWELKYGVDETPQTEKAQYDFTDGNEPKSVAIYASRLIYSGSDAFPNGVFGSRVSLGYEDSLHNFKPDLVDLTAEDPWFNPIHSAENFRSAERQKPSPTSHRSRSRILY